ncbi:MAG: rod shape-determining protein MreC [Burkholderiales bacterium]|nr:rod shape-determining protein MreC [Burkholderiales bacterium]
MLGTLDRTPPPFFRQGPSALTKLVLCTALALFLMAADARFTMTQPLRSAMATLLLPAVRLLDLPVAGWRAAVDYAGGLQTALSQVQTLEARLAQQAERSSRAERLTQENERLRALLELRPAVTVRSQAAEVLYEAPDPFSRKVFLDRGSQHGVVAGSPVINEDGVLGQVTRVYPLSSEVTLLVDKDAAIPVLNARTEHRSAAFGGGTGHTMELRFMAGNDDVQTGDVLTTSGVDGVYPAGLQVARVSAVDRRSDSVFARITLTPTAQPDGVRHVLVLEPLAAQQPPRPQPPEAERGASRPHRGGRR